jgi:hypothetical protein
MSEKNRTEREYDPFYSDRWLRRIERDTARLAHLVETGHASGAEYATLCDTLARLQAAYDAVKAEA